MCCSDFYGSSYDSDKANGDDTLCLEPYRKYYEEKGYNTIDCQVS